MALSYGSRGDDVKKLQEALNKSGSYNLDVDGIYGQKTQNAVKQWQTANGLNADGIAGDDTTNKLYGLDVQQPQQPVTDGGGVQQPSSTGTQQTTPKLSYDPSLDESYQQALAALQQAQQSLPSYKGTYDQQLQDIYNQIVNRDKFSYDLNSDMLYQQYANQYAQQGKMAMMDTMGQAAALTGGYGSSYGQAVGQQAYNAYMQEAADILPTLEAQAWERYNAEGDQMMQNLGMYQDLENTEYSRYTYDKEWAWQQEQANKENLQNMIASTGYTPTAEELAAAGMTEAEAQALKQGLVAGDPDYAYRMGLIDGESYKAMTGVYPAGYTPASSGGGGGDYYYGGGSGTYDPEIEALQQDMKDAGYSITVDGILGPETERVAKQYEQDQAKERLATRQTTR